MFFLVLYGMLLFSCVGGFVGVSRVLVKLCGGCLFGSLLVKTFRFLRVWVGVFLHFCL